MRGGSMSGGACLWMGKRPFGNMKRRMSDVVDQFDESRYCAGSSSLKAPKTIVSRLVTSFLRLIPKPNNKMHQSLNLYGAVEWICETLGIENVGDFFSACSVVLIWYGTVKVIINLSRTVRFFVCSFFFIKKSFLFIVISTIIITGSIVFHAKPRGLKLLFNFYL